MGRVPSIEDILVGLAVWLTGAVVGPQLGAMLLIMFGWFGGVLIGVWRIRYEAEDEHRRIKTAWFVLVSFIVTVGGAGVAANTLAPHLKSQPFELLFFVALAIPAIGPSWLRIGRWAATILKRVVHQRFGFRGENE